METYLGQSPNVYNPDLKEFVREDHMHFAQILKDLKPTYNLDRKSVV